MSSSLLSPLQPSPPSQPGKMSSTSFSRRGASDFPSPASSMNAEHYEDPNLTRRRRAGGALYGPNGPSRRRRDDYGSNLKKQIHHQLQTFAFRRFYTQGTYLVFLVMATISLLVFINSSISFIVTDLLGISEGVGDIVGTLGFADEIVVILAAPIWGVVSDALGERLVSGLAMVLIGGGFLSFTFLSEGMEHWWLGLLVARTIFAVGAAAGTTMMSALIPVLAVQEAEAPADPTTEEPDAEGLLPNPPTKKDNTAGKHAGLVGLFSAFGALFALTVFLPLPSSLQDPTSPPGTGLRRAYYLVTFWALLAAGMNFLGIPSLPRKPSSAPTDWKSRARTLTVAAKLGLKDNRIGLAYVGGFVSRACAVGISLFIPLYVNSFFLRNNLCSSTSGGRKDCAQAYILASTLSGISQLFALLGAPVFGYLADRPYSLRTQMPLILAGGVGAVGFGAFGTFEMMRVVEVDGTRVAKLTGTAYLTAAVMGLSKIASIVTSLGLLGKTISGALDTSPPVPQVSGEEGDEEHDERLIEEAFNNTPKDYLSIKGSISGVYSLTGGVGILVLTKLGGWLADRWGGGPFWVLACFNMVLGAWGAWVGFGSEGRIRLL